MFTLCMIALLGTASADLTYDGQCPDVKPVENFDLDRLAGTWYVVALLPLYNQMNARCSTSVYKVEGDGLTITNSHVVNGVEQYLDGTVKYADSANKSGRLIETFIFGERTKNVNPNILAIEYTKYAIAYSCRYDDSKKKHYVYAWILSRSKALQGDAEAAVENFLQTHTDIIDPIKLIITDFSNEACTFSSSVGLTGPKKN